MYLPDLAASNKALCLYKLPHFPGQCQCTRYNI